MTKYNLTQNPEDCCGCRGCELICKHHAIVMEEDIEGFLYPHLNRQNCVNCGLCEKVCPMSHGIDLLHESGKAYAAQNLSKKDLLTSSSGGVFIAIAKYIISKGGIVYGASFNQKSELNHKRVIAIEELESLKGSKYLQSNINSVYELVKSDLEDGMMVYFVGTPCQVAGLRLFLRKEYEQLVTSDFVCHGTPSNKLFTKIVSHIGGKNKAEFCNYSFRDKKVHGWSCSSSSSSWKKGREDKYIIYSKDMEAYYKAFICGDLMRMNCYKCPFARKERCGDITIADYWDVEKTHPHFPQRKDGVSLLIINSLKGGGIWSLICDQFYHIPLTMAQALTNPNLHEATPMTKDRLNSYDLAFNDYDAFVRKYYRGWYFYNKIKTYSEYVVRSSPFLFSVVSFLKHRFK